MKLFNKSIRLFTLIILPTLLGNQVALANKTGSIELSANIGFEGSCDISVPPPAKFNNGDPILPSQIVSKDNIAKYPFDLKLENCKGVGLTPKIIVTGETNSSIGETVFLDSSASTATGYGILLETKGNSVFKENSNLAKVKTISVVDNWDKYTQLSKINGSLPIIATLTCGTCNTDGRIGGNLKTNITFEFQYE